jgi:hypothetical protein
VIETASNDLGKDKPLVMLDGWNVTTTARSFSAHGGAAIAPNSRAIVTRAPATSANK